MREVAACVVSDGTVHLPKNSLSVGVNGDRMSRAPVLGQDEIAILEGSVRGSGRYSFPRRSAETTVITAAKASTSTSSTRWAARAFGANCRRYPVARASVEHQ